MYAVPGEACRPKRPSAERETEVLERDGCDDRDSREQDCVCGYGRGDAAYGYEVEEGDG